MRYKAIDLLKNERALTKDFQKLDQLLDEVETSLDSSSIEEELMIFDRLEDDLDDLHYLSEDTSKEAPLSGSKLLELKLTDALPILIAGFRPYKLDDFKMHCQNLINTHGFSKFRDAFDDLLLHSEHLNRREMRAIKHVNRYIMNRTIDTFAEITSRGSRNYATAILEVMEKPDSFFQEKALAAAQKDTYQKAKKLTIKAIQTETEKKIEGIEKQKLKPEEAHKAIEHVKKEAGERMAAIEQMTTMPLDYYIEAERRKMLLEAERSRALFKSYDKVADFVLNDILTRTTMDERTLTVERYLLMAEKLMARKNFDTAFQIYAAIQKTPVYRLAKTKEGLSPHAQKVQEELDRLMNNKGNFAAIRSRCEQENTFLPLNFTVTDITFCTDEKNSFVLDSKGKIVKGCSGLAGMDKVIDNCQKAATLQTYPLDHMLLEEVNHNHAEHASKTEAEINKKYDKISQELEPRGNPPESSTLFSQVKFRNLIRKGIVDPPKRSEQHHKLEEVLHTLKHGIQTQIARLKNLLVKDETKTESRISSIMEQMQDGVTSLFGKIQNKVYSLLHGKSGMFGEHSENHKENFLHLKEAWNFADEENELDDKEDEHPFI